jgi:DUF1680 family protein
MQGYMKLETQNAFMCHECRRDDLGDQSLRPAAGAERGAVEPGKAVLGASWPGRLALRRPAELTHFKVMRYLMALTRDARYGDSLERVLYNTILGAWPVREDGSCFYYSDFHHSGAKTYKRDIPGAPARWDHDGRWACCSGTLPQVVADYTISAYFRAPDGVYVNLYVPSRLNWTINSVHCVLLQQTAYPTDSLTTMRVELSSPLEFSLHLRVPSWAGRETSVSVNGTRLKETPLPGTFFALRRSWKSGDIVELDVNQPVRIEAVDRQNTDQVALIRGPQVLFAISQKQPELTREQLDRPSLSKAGNNDWALDLGQSSVLLRPFASIGDEVYQTYCRVLAT